MPQDSLKRRTLGIPDSIQPRYALAVAETTLETVALGIPLAAQTKAKAVSGGPAPIRTDPPVAGGERRQFERVPMRMTVEEEEIFPFFLSEAPGKRFGPKPRWFSIFFLPAIALQRQPRAENDRVRIVKAWIQQRTEQVVVGPAAAIELEDKLSGFYHAAFARDVLARGTEARVIDQEAKPQRAALAAASYHRRQRHRGEQPASAGSDAVSKGYLDPVIGLDAYLAPQALHLGCGVSKSTENAATANAARAQNGN